MNTESPENPEDAPAGVRTMAVVRWLLVGAMAIAALASVVFYVRGAKTSAPAADHGGHGAAPAGKATAQPARTPLYYCPMHPQIVQDHPGECPICSMTLVPMPEGATPAPSATMTPPAGGGVPGLAPVDISAERVQLIGVRTAKVERRALGGALRVPGVVAASERGLAQVTTRFSGYVEKVLVSETGQRVRRGQTLATVLSPELLRVQQEMLAARSWNVAPGAAQGGDGAREPGAGLAEDGRRRLELLGMSAGDIEAALRAGKPTAALPVRAPVDGYVTARNVLAGSPVEPGMALYQIANLATVWVLAEVPESAIARVRIGQAAELVLAAYPGERFSGQVAFASPTVDPVTRTMRLRIEVKNQAGSAGPKLRPGMVGEAKLELPSREALVIPAEAFVDTGEAQYVFIARDGGRFEPRRVERGASAGDDVEILSGLAEGETIVTTANFLVDSESRLRAAIEGQMAKARGGTQPAPAAPAAPPGHGQH